MKQTLIAVLATALTIAGAFAQDSHSHTDDDKTMHSHHSTGEADGTPGTINGYVRDVACLLRNPKAGVATTAVTKDCLEKCVRGGSPVGILTEEGALYLPISDTVPDTDARKQLLPYTGKYVKVSGKLFERGGLHAISIEKVQAIPRPANSKIPNA
jgi:hypothetical protein